MAYRAKEVCENIDAILDLMEEGIFLSDRDGMTVRVNKAYEQLTGTNRKQLEGKSVHQLVEEGVFNRILNPVIVKEKKPASDVQEFGKEKKTLHLRGFPIFDNQGEVCLVATFARDISIIRQMRDQIAEQDRLIEQYQGRMAQILGAGRIDEGIFASPAMQALVQTLIRIAQTDATVLLLGETGVGKDVLARMVHQNSPRKDRIFMKVDCGSIAENLIESELFGYAKGAFSGASSQGKPGYFEIANHGTIFLDEIGELSLPMQTRLLRILQDQEFMRVGSSKVQKVDVRIIAATNRELSKDIDEGKFRQDLYYRLNVAKLEVPPLRERPEDISLLARHFLDTYTAKYKKKMRLAPEVDPVFALYPWPGNVRELQNLIQQLVIITGDELIGLRDLPPRLCEYAKAQEAHPALPARQTPLPDTPKPLKDTMAEIEHTILTEALKRYGSYTKVAEIFQINRSTLFRKLRRFNPDFTEDPAS